MSKSKAWMLAVLLLHTPVLACAQSQESLVDPINYRGPAADQRAYKVGDVITVLVQEATKARSQAVTDASSTLGMEAGLNSPSTGYNADLALSGGNRGGAETTRVGELRTQVSVQVIGVEADGAMRIAGAHELLINGERQRIRISGLVRPQDIGPDNTVLSSRIANAELELAGRGVVSESQRQSLIYRAFKWLRLL